MDLPGLLSLVYLSLNTPIHNSRTSTYIIYTAANKLKDRFVTNRKKYDCIKGKRNNQGDSEGVDTVYLSY